MADHTWTATQAKAALTDQRATYIDEAELFEVETRPLQKALNDIISLQEEAERIKNFTSGGTQNTALSVVPAAKILAENLDYRLAVYLASQRTIGSNILGDAFQIEKKKYGTPPMSNQYDMVGTETTTAAWSAVAYSQLHYGTNVPVFIEDQPFTRGSFTETFVIDAMTTLGELHLLQNGYDVNNFSDTHSLVLIVDSLNDMQWRIAA